MNINYSFISKAILCYESLGFKYVEVPWLVSNDALDVTRPPEARSFETFAGNLVASGEQSFIEIRDRLKVGGKYQCVTPCFRDEKYDKYHKQRFLKNELIWVISPDDCVETKTKQCLDCASFVFLQCMDYKFKIEVVDTDIGKDLYINGIEVGSYGYRCYDGFHWIYGTGLAEPRFSQALEG
ncbi:MAG: hypothetical protein DWQ19_11020 [Crenarchaeota archaeon]|nr:MAG: hypothetical protein DWQ19_11020 [Thermoproteota archaeon]